MNFIKQFAAARRVSTPLVCVRTTDPASCVSTIYDFLQTQPDEKNTPVLLWDVVSGLTGLNPAGQQASNEANDGELPEKATARPSEMLRAALKLPEDSIVFMSNAHRFWQNNLPGGASDIVVQALWNCRNLFKESGRMLIAITTLGAILPPELAGDCQVLDQPLPDLKTLETTVKTTFDNEQMSPPTQQVIDSATDAIIGLPSFQAEQVMAMSTTKDSGLDLEMLWSRKVQAIEQVRGLQVYRASNSFADMGGADALKDYWMKVVRGRNRVRAVVFIDEIEKHFAGSGTDLSGVKTGMTGTFLTWTQERRARGILLVGHAGTGKSALAKAMATEANCPCIVLDFDGLQSGIIGSSGENLRAALAVIDAMAQEGIFMVGTCNKLDSLRPELRRRFKRGIWFSDLPNETERAAIWKIYRRKHNIPEDDKEPACKDWTGAEIEACCETADELLIPLKDAANYVVPISRSSPEAIAELRAFANNRFFSVSEPGVYRTEQPKTITGSGVRKIRSEGASA